MDTEGTNSIIVKFNWQDDVRRETMPAPLTFAGLETSARSAYDIAASSVLVFKYKDRDGDFITVACDRDLEEALKESPGRLYFHVFSSAVAEPESATPLTTLQQEQPRAPAQETQLPPSSSGPPPLDIPALLQTFGPMFGIAPQMQQGLLGNPQLMQLIQTAMQNPALLNLATQFLSTGLQQGTNQQAPLPFPFPFPPMNAGGAFPSAPAVDEQRETVCLQELQAMGFGDEQTNRQLLRRHGYDLTQVIQELTRDNSAS